MFIEIVLQIKVERLFFTLSKAWTRTICFSNEIRFAALIVNAQKDLTILRRNECSIFVRRRIDRDMITRLLF